MLTAECDLAHTEWFIAIFIKIQCKHVYWVLLVRWIHHQRGIIHRILKTCGMWHRKRRNYTSPTRNYTSRFLRKLRHGYIAIWDNNERLCQACQHQKKFLILSIVAKFNFVQLPPNPILFLYAIEDSINLPKLHPWGQTWTKTALNFVTKFCNIHISVGRLSCFQVDLHRCYQCTKVCQHIAGP